MPGRGGGGGEEGLKCVGGERESFMDEDDGGGDEGRVDKYNAAAANFLFGNIDEKGRLEEADYLDSEAKEQLSNVQSDLAVNNQELQVVATTMIAKKGGGDDEEDYDENYDGEVKHLDTGTYFGKRIREDRCCPSCNRTNFVESG